MSASGSSFWPTSRASQGGEDRAARQGGPTLVTAAAGFWPTPAVALTNDDESPATFRARQAEQKARGINGNGAGLPLTVAVKEMDLWPTPASRDHRSPNSQDSQDRRNEDSARGQQLPNFVEHLLPKTWGTPSTMDARARTYTRDRGEKGAERIALTGLAEAFPSTRLDHVSASAGPPSSNASPSSLRLAPAFVEWLMGWPVGWTLPIPGSLSWPGQTGSEPPATAWCHWLQRQRSWLCGLSWSYEPPAGGEPEARQLELI